MNATRTRALLLPVMLMALAGCGREDAGPAERLGKALDDAGAQVTNSVQDELAKVDDAVADARDKVKDATREASRGLERVTGEVGKTVERAGEVIQEKAGEADAADKDD